MTTNLEARNPLSAAQTAAQGRMEPNSQEAWLAVAEAMTSVTPVIRSMLVPAGMGADVDDVAQEAVISAVASAHRWAPERGPLVSWVTTIGKRRAIDHLRRAKRRATTVVVFAGQAGDDDTISVIDVAEESFEEQLLDRAEAWSVVRSVMGQVKVVLRNDETLRRAVVVLAECDGEVSVAARRLGISPAVAREARRQVVRMAIVVRHAQELHRRGVTAVDVSEALTCLPDVAGSWPRLVLDSIIAHGTVRRFTAADLRAATGWSSATCRQRLEDVSWLLSVINEIALRGEITSVEVPAC